MLTLTQCTDPARCIWYGDCGQSEKGLNRTCVSNDPPRPINNITAAALLREVCPQYFEGIGKLASPVTVLYAFGLLTPHFT